MATVNSEILRILKEKDLAIKTGTQSMLDILKELQKEVLSELGQEALTQWEANTQTWTIYHLRQMLGSIENQIINFKDQAKAEVKGNLDKAWQMGKDLVDVPLSSAGIYTGFHISTSGLDTLKDFAFHKIDGLSASAWEKIQGELTLGILGGKTPQEVAKAIGMNLKDPSIFTSIGARAKVITKLEMGRVFSTAAEMRMEEAADHIDGLEKQWRHAGHPMKPRLSHLAADGDHVPVDEPFDIGGVMMMYPRDPAAPLDEVINCGCDHVPFHPSWG